MKSSKKIATLIFAAAVAIMGLIQLNTQTAYAMKLCCNCTSADLPSQVCACCGVDHQSTCGQAASECDPG